MSKWTEGYVTDIDYTYDYNPDLNPLRLPLMFLNAGLAPPATVTACELGFGHGISANLHAAGSTIGWFGTDFNSAQAGFARGLASASGAAAQFFDQSFAEFCGRSDLPDFDFIGMHGVWSWISDENRRVIAEFIRRKLKVGGVVFVSYNVQPGFAGMIPLQELLHRHAESMGAGGRGRGHRIDGALDFADRLLAVSPGYSAAHPQMIEQLKAIRTGDRRYLAHEYFNRNWVPTSFSRVHEWLAPTKLEYACSANYFHTVDAWTLRPEQQALLEEIPDPVFREATRDFLTNQTFRMDYWVRGARRLTDLEKLEALLKQRVVLIRPRSEIPLKVQGHLGVFELLNSVCEPILDVLADHQPKTLGQIGQAVRDKRVSLPQVLDIVLTFMRTGALAPAQDDDITQTARSQTDKFNAFLCDMARKNPEIRYLASPVTGAGFQETGGRVALFFLHGISQGKRAPVELAAHASQIFQLQNLTILKQGKPVESPEETLAALTAQATFFCEKQLPVLKALQVA